MEIVHKDSLEYQDDNSDVEDEATVFHPDVLKMFRYNLFEFCAACFNDNVVLQVTYQGAIMAVGVAPMIGNSTSSTIGHVTTPRCYK